MKRRDFYPFEDFFIFEKFLRLIIFGDLKHIWNLKKYLTSKWNLWEYIDRQY